MKKYIFSTIAVILAVVAMAKICTPKSNAQNNQAKTSKVEKKNKNTDKKTKTKTKTMAALARPYKDPKDLAPEGTWKKRSEKRNILNLLILLI